MKNENDSGASGAQDNLHERLCAYVLGEGTPEERIAIEREMLQSPPMRAQCDTIERTIGLVKNAMAGSEALSPEAAETVVSAASASRPVRPVAMQSVPWLRIAAGIGAVALGFAIVRSSHNLPPVIDRADDTELAKMDRDASNARSLKQLQGFGYAGDERKSPQKAKGTWHGAENVVPPGGGDDGAAKKENKDQVENGFTEPLSSANELAAVDRKNVPAREGLLTDKTTARSEQQAQPRDSSQLGQPESKAAFDFGGTHPATSTSATQPPPATDNNAIRSGDRVFLEKSDQSSIGSTAQPAASSATSPYPTPALSGAGGRGRSGQSAGAVASNKTQSAPALLSARSSSGPSGPATAGGGPLTPAGPSAQDGDRLRHMGYNGAPPQEKIVKLEERGDRGDSSGEADVGQTIGRITELKQKRDQLERRESNTAPSGGVQLPNEELDALDKQIEAEESELLVLGDDDEAGQYSGRHYWQLTPAEQQVYLDARCRRILDGCRRMPNEHPRDMFFRFWGDNPFEVAALDRLSTFSADVDTASYALARRYLNEGQIPEKAQIRTEEFVNYFKSDVPAPTNGVFAIHTDLTPSRFSTDTTRQMMRVVVRGKEMSKVERQPLHLTFVVDVSGSMREQNRLEMVKHAMRLLVSQLEPYDKIGIVKFSSDASVVLQLTSVDQRALIESAIEPLQPEGSTNSNAGLQLGYAIALGGIDANSISRVVFLSDGVANVGETDPAKIAEQVKPMREKGIYLNTIGVGMNNHNDVLLEQLADKADGMCNYIDSPEEAKKQLVDNFSGAFQPIARDVKIQVEFDPAQVLRYRLLGYENRAIADADFRNDKVDAGELGSGHQVTALYEIERQAGSSGDGPLATVRVRWKEPRNFGKAIENDAATEIAQTVSSSDVKTFEAAGQGYRKAVIVAQFAEVLRRSIHARGDSLDDLLNESLRLQKEIPNDADFNELVLLISKSKDLILRTMPACDELCQAIDQVREASYRRAQIEQLRKEMDAKTLEDLKRQNDLLEARLRELVKRRLESQGK